MRSGTCSHITRNTVATNSWTDESDTLLRDARNCRVALHRLNLLPFITEPPLISYDLLDTRQFVVTKVPKKSFLRFNLFESLCVMLHGDVKGFVDLGRVNKAVNVLNWVFGNF